MPESPASLAEALVQLQARLPRITKDETARVEHKGGGAHTYRYVNLSSITDAVFPLLAELHLVWMCRPTLNKDGRFVLQYSLIFADNHEAEHGEYPLPEGTPQTIGGAITYARRYALCAVLGIAPADDDDDAQAAEQDAREARAAAWRPPANPHSRKATRHRADRQGPLPDDQWTNVPADEGPAPEDLPETSTEDQHRTIGILMGRHGMRSNPERMLAIRSILQLNYTPETTKHLSFNDAAKVIRELGKKGES